MYRAAQIVVKSVVVLGLTLAVAATGTAGSREEALEEARRFEERLEQWQARALGGEAEAVLHELAALPQQAELDPRVHNVRGLALIALERPEEAIAHFERGIRLQPERPELHFNLATALLDLGRTGRALAEFEQTLELDPGSVEARLGLATGLMRLRRFAAAIEALMEVQARQPGDARVLRALADAHDASGDPDAARSWWVRLEASAPSVDTARRLGELARRDAPDRARAHFADCVGRDSTATDCAEALAELALEAGELSTARQMLERRLGELSETGVFNLLTVYLRIDDPAAAELLLGRREPALGVAWGVIALLRRGADDGARARDAVHRGLELDPESADLHNLLGVLLEEAGDRAGARAAWRRALDADPDHAEARANLDATREGP